VEACEARLGENRPLYFGRRGDILKRARERAQEVGGFIYGERENGGTATLYVSRVPFEQIDAKLKEKKSSPHMGKARSLIEDVNRWAKGFFISPLVLAVGAVGLAFYERLKKNDKPGKGDGK
jgi:formate dehydrogenase iron-sulfur subunit